MPENHAHILIFISRESPRMRYVFHHVFQNILRIPIRFTKRIEEFVAYNGPKFSYTGKRLGDEFHIHAGPLLYENGIRPVEIAKGNWAHLPVIFATDKEASLPFDLFSAIFYLISRYEEYLPHQTDEHGRYTYAQSIAHAMGFLDRPLVEQWLHMFVQQFREKYPGLQVPRPDFRFQPVVNVTVSHLYKHKGLLRFLGGIADTFFRLQFRKTWARIKYVWFEKKDPYDTFNKFIALGKQNRLHPVFFFLVGTYSQYDHNISIGKPPLKRIIKTVADYAETGLLIAYESALHPKRIRYERQKLEELIHKPVNKAHFHYYRNIFPDAYRHLVRLEFRDDYTMGYPRITGYRASTSHPFPFYDFQEETPTELRVHPVVVNDYQLKFIYKLTPEEALNKLIETGNEIRQFGGVFHPVFHNAILSEYEEWKDWSDVYIKLLKHFAGEGD